MKVLHLISGGDSGGAKTHVLSLLKGLNNSIQADLACYMEGEFSHDARELGLNVSVFGGSFLKGIIGTKKLIKRGGYDIIHCHGSRANLTGALLKGCFDIPFISTVHSDYRLDYLGRPMANLCYGSLNKIAVRAMDSRICVSDKMRETLISRAFDPNKLLTIYNGVDFSRPAPNTDRAKWFSELGCDFSEDCIVIGVAARLDPVKDVGTAIRGFAEAAQSCDRLRLLIAGDGQEMNELKALAEELGVADRVFFIGWLSNMEDFYASIDINVISSISETFPYAVTEAARAGIPSIASRVGGLPMLIRHNETGMLFDSGDYRALGKCLLKAAGDEDLRHRMGKAVYDRAKAEFSMESTYARQIEIYETILRRRAQERNGVVICGAYGHGNAGDEAILKAIIDELKTVDKDMRISVISKRASHTKSMHAVNAVSRWNIAAQRRELKRAKLFINGGGSLIQDVTSRRSLLFYLYTMIHAKRCGCRVQMYGCGIGPIRNEKDRQWSAAVMDKYVDVITLRDPESLRFLNELKVTKPELVLTGDPVLNISAKSEIAADVFLEQCGIDPEGSYICMSLRPWSGYREKVGDIAEALRRCHDKHGLAPVFLPMNYKKDLSAIRDAAEAAGLDCAILPNIADPELAVAVMKKMKLVAAMRLHTVLYAACAAVPSVGISYDPKVSGFADYIGGCSIDLNSVTADALSECIDTALSSAKAENSLKQLETIKEREKLNIAAAKRLLED